MNNNSKNQKKQKRSIAAICLAVCLVAALTIAGTYIFGERDTDQSQASTDNGEAVADSAADLDNQGTTEETASDLLENESSDVQDENEQSAQESSQSEIGDDAQSVSSESEQSDDSQSQNAQTEETVAAAQTGLSLEWPVEGNVLMSYSMDKTVYFKTLNQYKYNPAMIIGGEEGAEVVASATGTVTSVGVTAQTGTTVTMNIGSGYSVVYGQLKEVSVSEGDYLDTGDSIGYLSAPTKYYTEEGCNLYYQVLKNGQPVNPLDFLEEE